MTIFLALNEEFKAAVETQSLSEFTEKAQSLTGDRPANQTVIRKEFEVFNFKHIPLFFSFVESDFEDTYSLCRCRFWFFLYVLRSLWRIYIYFVCCESIFFFHKSCRNWWKLDQSILVQITRFQDNILQTRKDTLYYHVSNDKVLIIRYKR